MTVPKQIWVEPVVTGDGWNDILSADSNIEMMSPRAQPYTLTRTYDAVVAERNALREAIGVLVEHGDDLRGAKLRTMRIGLEFIVNAARAALKGDK